MSKCKWDSETKDYLRGLSLLRAALRPGEESQ